MIWDHYDEGTARAVLALYRSADPEVLGGWGRAPGSPRLSGPGRLGRAGSVHLDRRGPVLRGATPRGAAAGAPRSGTLALDRRPVRDRHGHRLPGRPGRLISLTIGRSRASSVSRNRAPAAAGVDRPPAPVRPLLPRLPGLSARARIDRREERPGLRQRRADRRPGEEPRDLLRAGPPAGRPAPRLDHRHRQLALRQLPLHDHGLLPGLALPVPQRQLLLRPQHVHGGDGHRPDRVRLLPDRAPADAPRRGLHRHPRRRSRRSSRTRTPSACSSTSTPPCRACTSASRR